MPETCEVIIDTGDYYLTVRVKYTSKMGYTPTDRGCITGLEIEDIQLDGPDNDVSCILRAQMCLSERYADLDIDANDPQAVAEFRAWAEVLLDENLDSVALQIAEYIENETAGV